MSDDSDSPAHVSRLPDDARGGNSETLETLLPLAYAELRRLAAAYLRRERPGQTLQATALVHEVYLRLLREKNTRWQNRAHFAAIAAGSMRQILVERARARGAVKRAGHLHRVTLAENMAEAPAASIDVEALDQALTRLADVDPEHARLVELRFFGGLTIEETAEVLGVSPATVKRDWVMAKAWLKRELSGERPAAARRPGSAPD